MTDELWKYVSRETPKNRPVSQHAALFCLIWYSLLRERHSGHRWGSCFLCSAEGAACGSFLKSVNTGIQRILEIFLNAAKAVPHHGWDCHKTPQIKGCWANTGVGRGDEGADRKKIEKERTRRVRIQASAFMSFQSSLSNKGLHREICRLWFFIQFWIGPIGGICLHKRETFGLGLSQAQTSMSQLSAAPCQRRSFLPNSCNSEPNRCAWGCSKSNTWCLKRLLNGVFFSQASQNTRAKV